MYLVHGSRAIEGQDWRVIARLTWTRSRRCEIRCFDTKINGARGRSLIKRRYIASNRWLLSISLDYSRSWRVSFPLNLWADLFLSYRLSFGILWVPQLNDDLWFHVENLDSVSGLLLLAAFCTDIFVKNNLCMNTLCISEFGDRSGPIIGIVPVRADCRFSGGQSGAFDQNANVNATSQCHADSFAVVNIRYDKQIRYAVSWVGHTARSSAINDGESNDPLRLRQVIW